MAQQFEFSPPEYSVHRQAVLFHVTTPSRTGVVCVVPIEELDFAGQNDAVEVFNSQAQAIHRAAAAKIEHCDFDEKDSSSGKPLVIVRDW